MYPVSVAYRLWRAHETVKVTETAAQQAMLLLDDAKQRLRGAEQQAQSHWVLASLGLFKYNRGVKTSRQEIRIAKEISKVR